MRKWSCDINLSLSPRFSKEDLSDNISQVAYKKLIKCCTIKHKVVQHQLSYWPFYCIFDLNLFSNLFSDFYRHCVIGSRKTIFQLTKNSPDWNWKVVELVKVLIGIAICHSMVDLMTSCHVTDWTSRTTFRLSDQNSKTSSSNSNELFNTLECFDISLETIWLDFLSMEKIWDWT